MSDLPLSPFLASLATDGIQLTISDYARLHHVLETGGNWTITRLRDTLLALLAHDADQQELFLRRFNDFFAPSLTIDDAVAALDLQQVLADLKRLAAEQEQVALRSQPIFSLPTISLPTLPRPPKPQFGFWTLWSTLLVLGLLTVGYFLSPFVLPLSPTKPPPTPVMQVTPSVSSSQSKPVSPRKRLYTDVPYVAKISYEPLTTWEAWQRDAGLAAFFFFAALLYGLYLWRSHKIPEDEAPSYNPDGPRHFPLGSIGGQPAPLLSDATLNELADCMGYFQSDEGGHRLDVPTSIQATMRKGGVPALTFHKRQQLRSLLILEDDFAEALTWNSLARELAVGMARLGVPVVYGRFHGSPAQFKTAEGAVHRLEDWEDQRRGYLLLLFTDGKSLQRQVSTFTLEALARWPMVAWMELREPRAWDESATLPTHYGIPLYPATPAGALKAVRRFLTEHGAEMDYARNGNSWRGLTSQAGTQTDAYIERLLGDALLWAQDCAMFQPISPGLVDALRRAFHPNLPVERIERLYELPDTQYDVAGLRFSADVLRVLRTGFLVRRTEGEQEKVLRFLVQEIEKAEPTEENSLAHLAWDAVKERVRLELDQDEALARLAQLAKTPIGPAISASLDGFGFYEGGNQATTTPKIPLRIKPNNRYAWQRLARIADSFNIPKLEAYPIALGHQLAIGLLAVLFLGSSSLSLKNYLSPSLPGQNWRVVTTGEAYAMLESKDIKTDKWNMEKSGELHTLTTLPLRPEREYQALLYSTGYKTINRISVKNHQMVVVLLQTKAEEAYCKEEPPDSGLIVQRCPESSSYGGLVKQATWRGKLGYTASRGRLMSIGLEIADQGQNDKLLDLRNLLLDTSSVDIIYRIQPDPNGQWRIDKAIQYIYEDLGPMIERSQLIWWTDNEAPITPDLNHLISNFERNLKLSDKEHFDWDDKLVELLDRGPGELVTEQEILKELYKTVPPREIAAQIVLYRSSKAIAEITVPNVLSASATPVPTNALTSPSHHPTASAVNKTLTLALTAKAMPSATNMPTLIPPPSMTPTPVFRTAIATPNRTATQIEEDTRARLATAVAATLTAAVPPTLTPDIDATQAEEAVLGATETKMAEIALAQTAVSKAKATATANAAAVTEDSRATTAMEVILTATRSARGTMAAATLTAQTRNATRSPTPTGTPKPTPTPLPRLILRPSPSATLTPAVDGAAATQAVIIAAVNATLTAVASAIPPTFTNTPTPLPRATRTFTPTPPAPTTAEAVQTETAVAIALVVLPTATATATPTPNLNATQTIEAATMPSVFAATLAAQPTNTVGTPTPANTPRLSLTPTQSLTATNTPTLVDTLTSTPSPATTGTNTPLPTRSQLTPTQTVTPTEDIKLSNASVGGNCPFTVADLKAINECSDLNSNWVCVAKEPVEFSPVEYRVFQARDRRPFSVLNEIKVGEGGILVMNLQLESKSAPTKIIVVGSSSTQTTGKNDTMFIFSVEDGRYICNTTPPGMVVQTAEGTTGVITVNGIDIIKG